jgi:thiol-disulfide isomerase/thioredoxin
VSAGLSISLAALAWLEFGSEEVTISTTDEDDELVVLSKENIVNYRKKGVVTGIASFGVATVLALGLFLSVDDGASSTASYSASSASSANSINSGTLVASTEPIIDMSQNIPPPITTKSSQEALSLANDLSTLNSRMFGAFWCSHCYDQKQSLGLQAMQSIPYVECDKDGYNNQRALCRERDVPGYPTWEIGGELFPGERSLDELREIVDEVLSRRGRL